MKKITLLLCFLLALVALFAQEKQANYARVKIYASGQEDFKILLQKGICLENLDVKKGVYIIGEFSALELEKITETQIPFEILIENMSEHYVKQNDGYSIDKLNEEMRKNPKTFKGNRTPSHFHLGSMGGYLTLEEIMEDLDKMRTDFPNLISVRASFPQQTLEGRNVYWVRISNNPDMDQEKPRVLYTALTHAREPAGMQQLIYQMWDLLENYGVDPEITYCIDNEELYFIPCVCPDGYAYNEQTNPYGGGMWRKNRKPNGNGTYGIDLNRNWGYQWGYDNQGSSPDGYSETYRGTAPFSEFETQMLKNFCESKEILLCLNNHTYSNYLVFPYGYINTYPPEYPIYHTYAERLTSENKYAFGNCFQLLNYYANGDSNDWMQGEQESKNMIYAFTPEAGDPSEGFWPPAYRIEEICAGHVVMNKYMMRFALPYAEIMDKSPLNFVSLNNNFAFELLSLGQVQNVSFTVTIEPISDNIQSVQTTPLIFENLNTLDVMQGELSLILEPNIAIGDEVAFDICIHNGSITHKHRFTKIFGVLEKLLEDHCETMEHWTSTTWNITASDYVSPTHSITDSPSGNYPNNANRTIYSKNSYSLNGAIATFVEFEAKWSIEAGYDYVQFLVSENDGATWVPQHGKYTKLGGSNQSYNQPLYDGIQNSWVHETIDLSAYKGKNINLGFRLISDVYETADGFYFDDFTISIIRPQQTPILNFPDTISFLDVEMDCEIHVLDYINSNTEELTVHWEGNENIKITYNEEAHLLHIGAQNWTGCENVTFFIGNSQGESTQEVVIQCIKSNTVREFGEYGFNVFYNASTKKILITDVKKVTSFSLFNLEGKLLNRFDVHNKDSEVNVSYLQAGIYLLKTNFGVIQKVVVY